VSQASIAEYIGARTMVRQQQAQAITPPPAGVHIGTEAFAVAGTNEWHVLTQIKDTDCDAVVGIMGRAFCDGGRGVPPLTT